jgi:hypothetical protein
MAKIKYELSICKECEGNGVRLDKNEEVELCPYCKGDQFILTKPALLFGMPAWGNTPRFRTKKLGRQFIENGDAEDWWKQPFITKIEI